MASPNWQHDCKSCTFLGTLHEGRDWWDFYYCGQLEGIQPTLIARFGDDGPEYISGINPHDTWPLKVAQTLAAKNGLVKV